MCGRFVSKTLFSVKFRIFLFSLQRMQRSNISVGKLDIFLPPKLHSERIRRKISHATLHKSSENASKYCTGVFLACTVRKSNNLRIKTVCYEILHTYISGYTKMLLKLSFISVQICAFDSISKKTHFLCVFTALNNGCVGYWAPHSLWAYLNGKECLGFPKRCQTIGILCQNSQKRIENSCKQSVIHRSTDHQSTANGTPEVKSVFYFSGRFGPFRQQITMVRHLFEKPHILYHSNQPMERVAPNTLHNRYLMQRKRKNR